MSPPPPPPVCVSLLQVRDEGAASLLSLRESLGAAHDADRALLLREMAELQRRVSGLRRLAAAESEAAEKRVDEVQVGGGIAVYPAGRSPIELNKFFNMDALSLSCTQIHF